MVGKVNWAVILLGLTCILASTTARAVESQEQLRLFEALSFDANDLALNRAGKTTLHQRPWVAPFLALSQCLVTILVVWAECAGRMGSGTRWRPGLFLVVFFFVGSLFLLMVSRPSILDVTQGTACRLEGQLRDRLRMTGSKGRNDSANLYFDGHRISTFEGASALEIGRPYRVYYNCHSKTLASIEPI